MRYSIKTSEREGLDGHQAPHRQRGGIYRRCTTLEECKTEYVKYWEFVAKEMNGPRIF